jgi:2-keto-4-pentenoate hydratase
MNTRASRQEEVCAAELREAQKSRSPIAPLRRRVPALDAPGAYRIQELNTRHALANGRRLVGRKIGLTSVAVQRQLGVDQPDYGMLFSDMHIENGGTLQLGSLIQPKIEGEIAFVLGKDLVGEDCTQAQLVAAIDHAVAALEIVDSRIENWHIGLVDTVADNASSALFVLGAQPAALEKFDPVACLMQLTANGVTVSQGSGRMCLGSPVISALWLARKMASVGWPLQAGDIVLTGALGPMVTIAAETHYRLEIEGLGCVEVIAKV